MTAAAGSGEAVGREQFDELRRLAREATVGVRGLPGAEGARPRGWGSGFLVAPGWVLTCAHVLVHADGRRRGTGPGEELGIVHGDRIYRGRLAYHLAGPTAAAQARWTDGTEEPSVPSALAIRPDLALVGLLEEIPAQPCVWLTDRSGVPVGAAHLFGRQDGALPAAEHWNASCRLVGQEREQLLLDADARVPRGISGGPLVDLELGEVSGVVKARSDTGTTVLAVPVSALRALTPAHHLPGTPDLGPHPYDALMRLHDRWHADRQRAGQGTTRTWSDVQLKLPAAEGRKRTVLDRLRVLDLLAALPSPRPAVVGRITAETLGTPGRTFSPRLLTWRDGQGMLYAPDAARELRAFLHFALLIAAELDRTLRDTGDAEGTRHVEALRDWALWRSGELGPEDRKALGTAARALPSAVLVEFLPVPYDDGTPVFDWTISLGYGGGTWTPAVAGDDPWGLSFERAVWKVERHLLDALEDADGPGGTSTRLEVALPPERLGTAVHDWLAARGTPVGLGRAVVVRDAARRDSGADPWAAGRDADARHRWHDRWHRVTRARRLHTVRLSGEGSVLGLDALREQPAGAVPVLCLAIDSGPGSEAASTVLESGYAVAVWSVDGHPPGPCGKECDTFHTRVSDLLGRRAGQPPEAVTIRELPQKIMELRREARGGNAGAAWAGQVVLLYDDPGNPLPPSAPPRVEFPPS
ncbi:trypsin-like peptidase domain-containing protein [Streptomyces sp. Tu 3180]|uniref:VMAP-C domain-containing protein n=1 Tax=Streptomyces sp. Tu 3180 TaxID=2682611 RepID=UPI0013571EDC|nr:trypsin-like peptidase domain-containing protein [Streptomyces sp. Tu 3180]KAF3469234.1 trypsin-like peptidase domain-containing protein [Streptomyces sp. Tu 3180]